jgi:hydroxypyruvate reductase
MASAINATSADAAIHQHVTRDSQYLIIQEKQYDLNHFRRIFVVGAGKAGSPMIKAIDQILGNNSTQGMVIVKEGYLDPNDDYKSTRIKLIEAGHPIPDQRNLKASSELISLVSSLNQDDLVVCLISGGGSALLTSPAMGVTLDALQATTHQLLACGATISEINTIRKHLDDLKGGGLARYLSPATVITLILSDVIGDSLETIASGPTVGDPTTFLDAWAILNKYQIVDHIPEPIKSHLASGMEGKIRETLKPGDRIFNKVNNVIVGNNQQASSAAMNAAKDVGFNALLLTTTLQGEASEVGRKLSTMAVEQIFEHQLISRPACLIAGGETTVTLMGTGLGGRNQELALGSVSSLAGSDQIILATLATDGGDGPTDAAGAVVTSNTYSLGKVIGLDLNDYLLRNDSYHYFDALGDLIKTGPTLTNVNDLVFIISL